MESMWNVICSGERVDLIIYIYIYNISMDGNVRTFWFSYFHANGPYIVVHNSNHLPDTLFLDRMSDKTHKTSGTYRVTLNRATQPGVSLAYSSC